MIAHDVFFFFFFTSSDRVKHLKKTTGMNDVCGSAHHSNILREKRKHFYIYAVVFSRSFNLTSRITSYCIKLHFSSPPLKKNASLYILSPLEVCIFMVFLCVYTVGNKSKKHSRQKGGERR